MEKLTATINESCEALSTGRTNLYRLINEGRIETITVGRRRLVVVQSLHDFVKKRRAAKRNESKSDFRSHVDAS